MEHAKMATSLPAAARPDTCEPVPATTTAKRSPQTAIEFDPPTLLIRKHEYEFLYTLAEVPCGFDGRAFTLTRDIDGQTYNVLIARNGQDSVCDCAGFSVTSNDPTGRRCKHLDAIHHLMDAGRLDHPEAGRPGEPQPSPAQLAAEAGVDLPF
jgi:hypothetical protein